MLFFAFTFCLHNISIPYPFSHVLFPHICHLQVSAYGFMTEDYRKYSNYYAEKHKSNVIFYANHDYILEKNLWKSLHERKIMKLYQRT